MAREKLRLRRYSMSRANPPARQVQKVDITSLDRELKTEQENQPVTSLLYDRLSSGDVADVQARLAGDPQLAGGSSDEQPSAWAVLAYGMWLGVPVVAEKTGLVSARPPDDIHAMARGPLSAAGGLYEADLVIDALAKAGVEVSSLRAGLDFGCSSGRVVRVLAAAYPHARWMGCDPNERAIAWASENLPEIEFFASPQHPPLRIASNSLDLVIAISVWSHFAPELGLRWFEEAHRILRPGGHLVFTTHGLQSISFAASSFLRPIEQLVEIQQMLYRRGWWYAAEFGPEGDWGVADPSWGTAFVSPEWIVTRLCPPWRLLSFAPGRNAANQDVYVLQRS